MKNPFRSFKSILVVFTLFISVFMLVASVILFLTETGNNAKLYALGICLIGLMTLIPSICYMKQTSKKLKKSLIETLSKDIYLVEHFKYTMDEWKNFVKKTSLKAIKSLRFCISVSLIVGVILIVILSGEKREIFWGGGTTVALLTISLTSFFYYQLRKLKTTNTAKIAPEARITKVGILIGKTRVISFNNQDGSVEQCSFETYLGMNCICLKINRPGGRQGPIYQWYYLLIPKSRENETSEIINKINRSIEISRRFVD